MRARVSAALPVVVVAIYLATATRSPLVGGPLTILTLLAALVGPRLDVDLATQRVFSLVLGILSIALFRATDDPLPDSRLAIFWVGVATASLLVASFRLVCRAVEGGLRGTVVVAAIALLACGAGRVGRSYALVVALFLLAMSWAFRANDDARRSLASTSTRSHATALAVALLASIVGAAVVLPLRPAAEWAQRRALSAYDEAYAKRGGRFGDTMRMGRLDPMLRSDAVVARLRGPRADLLRVVVFDRYEDGRFLHAHEAQGKSFRPPASLAGADVVVVTRSRAANDRIPLPAGATEIAAESSLTREPFGVVRTADETKRYAFRAPRSGESTAWPPTEADLELPADLRGELEKIARAWNPEDGTRASSPAQSTEAALRRIETHLRADYRYELGRDHLGGRDPVLHFLEREPVGHCEYFAGAMVLLARAAGVPARIALGYRVVERNPIDGHWVVRERNAHAWVEAWVPGRGWVTSDPTPITEHLDQVEDEAFATASEDAAIAWWEIAEAWLAARSLGELVVAVLLGTALFAVVRLRRAREERGNARGDPLGDAAAPTAHAAAVLAALAERGLLRDRAESIEHFAARIGDDTTAAVLLRYAAHRYGDVDDRALADDLRARASALRAT